jgi:serine/threonine protein kinase
MPPHRRCPTCNAEFTQGEQFCAIDAAPLVDAPEPEEPPAPIDPSVQRRLQRWAQDPFLGRVIADRYRLCEVIGEGGMGLVYRAEHRVLDRAFAVKVLRRELTLDKMSRARFDREARAASLVCHTHIVSMYDFGYTDDGLGYLVMEYLDGMTLAAYAAQAPGYMVPVSTAVDVTMQVAQALRHAHERGVVHRDIKPANIFLTCQDGDSDYVKVLDFGIARILDQAALTQVKDGPPGTVPYMAPEMFNRPNYLSPAIDQYAVGVLLFHLLTGQPPFWGSDIEMVRGHLKLLPPRLSTALVEKGGARVPAALDDLVASLLAKDPAQRPDAAATLDALMEIRPQLVPRSLRSLLAVQTMVLSESQQGLLLHGAPTFVLPSDRPRLPLIAARNAALQQTLHVLPVLDELESELQRVSAQLGKQALALLRKRWPRGVLPGAPAPLLELAQRTGAAEQEEETYGVQVALLREQVHAEQRRAEQHRFDLQRRLVAARDATRAQARPAGTQEPLTLPGDELLEEPIVEFLDEPTSEFTGDIVELEAIERECLQPPPNPALDRLAHKLHEAQSHLQELQAVMHALRRQLAGQTLHTYLTDVAARGGADAVQDAAYHQLESTLARFDEQTAAVTLVCEKLPFHQGAASG